MNSVKKFFSTSTLFQFDDDETIKVTFGPNWDPNEVEIHSSEADTSVTFKKEEIEAILPSLENFVSRTYENRYKKTAKFLLQILDQNETKCDCTDHTCHRCVVESLAD